LLERELRKAIASQGIESLPLYPEGRACVRLTTRQVLDVFEPIARHTISKVGSNDFEMFTTELAPIHRMILAATRAHRRLPSVINDRRKNRDIHVRKCEKDDVTFHCI